MKSIDPQFDIKVQAYWDADRIRKTFGSKRLLLLPTMPGAGSLLRAIGLLNGDASMSRDSTRKFMQINHMLQLVRAHLDELAARHSEVRVLDIGCGNSYMTFLVTWYFKHVLQKPCSVLGVDRNAACIERSRERSALLGWQDALRFLQIEVDSAGSSSAGTSAFDPSAAFEQAFASPPPVRAHLLIALHACDLASDHALAIGIRAKADIIAVAPCCQAELAAKWKELSLDPSFRHPMAAVFASPNLRRETAAQCTDALRLLLMRAHGYEASATEFIESAHTPKNRLLLGIRRGNYLDSARVEHQALRDHLGGSALALESLLASGRQD